MVRDAAGDEPSSNESPLDGPVPRRHPAEVPRKWSSLRLRGLIVLTVAGTTVIVALAIYLILGCKAVVR